jgi:hypothetical protein
MIRHEFEPVGPTMLKKTLGFYCQPCGGQTFDFQPIYIVFFPSSKENISQQKIELPTIPFGNGYLSTTTR